MVGRKVQIPSVNYTRKNSTSSESTMQEILVCMIILWHSIYARSDNILDGMVALRVREALLLQSLVDFHRMQMKEYVVDSRKAT